MQKKKVKPSIAKVPHEKITLASIQAEIRKTCEPFVQEIMEALRENALLKGHNSVPSIIPDNGWTFTNSSLHIDCVAAMLREDGLKVETQGLDGRGFNVSWDFASK